MLQQEVSPNSDPPRSGRNLKVRDGGVPVLESIRNAVVSPVQGDSTNLCDHQASFDFLCTSHLGPTLGLFCGKSTSPIVTLVFVCPHMTKAKQSAPEEAVNRRLWCGFCQLGPGWVDFGWHRVASWIRARIYDSNNYIKASTRRFQSR